MSQQSAMGLPPGMYQPPGPPLMGMPPGMPQQLATGLPPGMYQPPAMGAPPGPPGMGMPSGMSQPPGMGLPPGMSQPPGMGMSSGMPQPSGMGMPPGMSQQPGMGMPPGMSQQPGMGMPQGMPQPPGMGMSQGMSQQPGMGMPPGMGLPPGIPQPPGMGMNSQSGMMAYDQAPRGLHLSSLPSAVQVFDDDRQTRSGLFPTGYPNAEQPPLSNTEFFGQDQGNCNPKFMRSSLYCVPLNHDILKQTSIPFAVSLTPFANLSTSEHPLPVVDLGDLGPVRCHRCKAYICAFMEFVDGGRKFKCPFCHTATQVDEMYFAHLDHTGRRTDIQHRPELCFGSYEFVATKLYCKNGIPPKQPAFIFMLDVSYNAVRNGLVTLFCQKLPELLRQLPKDYNQEKSSMRIGFATYDQSIHFYNLANPTRPEMMIANDVADVFVPFVEGFFVNYDNAEDALKRCLIQVKKNFAETRITEPMLGPAIQAGIEALRAADCAGKVFVFHTTLPTFDAPGRLKNREDRKVLGTDKEKIQLSPAVDYYSKLGEECIKVGCSVDLFLFPNSNVDLASIAPVCSTSGGAVYKYQYFDADRDGERFLKDLQHNISRPIAFDIMMRVRTSTGIRPTGFYGNFYMQNTTDIEVGTLDSDKGMSIEIKYDDKLDEQTPVAIQTAVLFTSVSGQRRLRIHNLSLPASADYQNVYRYADIDSVVDYFFKYAAKAIREKNPKDLREELTHRCAQILATYREKCSNQSPASQLVLPEGLKLFPLYVGCILRNDAIGGGSEMTVDDRTWLMSMVPSMRVDLAIRGLYPLVLPLTKLKEVLTENSNVSVFNAISPVRASYEFLNPSEVYLIENGMIGFIWIGHNAPQDFCSEIFNVATLQHLDTETHHIPVRENPSNVALHNLLAQLNKNRPYSLKTFIIKQQDSLESWMKKFLVEDKYATGSASYVDFLCEIHREIRTIIS
uniref:Protein transport protein Sec24C n=1 Tax=Panagrolaimus sp. JU765 TaxID=591449 RepID=A0AC34QJP2_9BILA